MADNFTDCAFTDRTGTNSALASEVVMLELAEIVDVVAAVGSSDADTFDLLPIDTDSGDIDAIRPAPFEEGEEFLTPIEAVDEGPEDALIDFEFAVVNASDGDLDVVAFDAPVNLAATTGVVDDVNVDVAANNTVTNEDEALIQELVASLEGAPNEIAAIGEVSDAEEVEDGDGAEPDVDGEAPSGGDAVVTPAEIALANGAAEADEASANTDADALADIGDADAPKETDEDGAGETIDMGDGSAMDPADCPMAAAEMIATTPNALAALDMLMADVIPGNETDVADATEDDV